jgi:hypothetical protein
MAMPFCILVLYSFTGALLFMMTNQLITVTIGAQHVTQFPGKLENQQALFVISVHNFEPKIHSNLSDRSLRSDQ